MSVNGITLGRSSTKKKTLDPDWDQERKSFLVTREEHLAGGKKKSRSWSKSKKQTTDDKTAASRASWGSSAVVVLEVFDHDMVGSDDPLGRVTLTGQELLGCMAFGKAEAWPLFERSPFDNDDDAVGADITEGNDAHDFTAALVGETKAEDSGYAMPLGPRAKGTLTFSLSLSAAGTVARAAQAAEAARLAEIELRRVESHWPVWLRLHDEEAHHAWWVHTPSGNGYYNPPSLKALRENSEGSASKTAIKEAEAELLALRLRCLPEEMEPRELTEEEEEQRWERPYPFRPAPAETGLGHAGSASLPSSTIVSTFPPLQWLIHTSARRLSMWARVRCARERVLRARAKKMRRSNGGGSAQEWVQAFDPITSRTYWWNALADDAYDKHQVSDAADVDVEGKGNNNNNLDYVRQSMRRRMPLVWDNPPVAHVAAMGLWLRCMDPLAKQWYYLRTRDEPISVVPSTAPSLLRVVTTGPLVDSPASRWMRSLPMVFTPGGSHPQVSASITIQAAYRGWRSRMQNGWLRKVLFERPEVFVWAEAFTRQQKRRRLRIAKSSSGGESLTAPDEIAEQRVNMARKKLKGICEAFSLPWARRMSRRTDRRKALNSALKTVEAAIEASLIAGQSVTKCAETAMAEASAAAAAAAAEAANGKSNKSMSPKATTQTLKKQNTAASKQEAAMKALVTDFEFKVTDAAKATAGATAIVCWREVETAYRLKRLLAGLTSLDIYRLPAPANEDMPGGDESGDSSAELRWVSQMANAKTAHVVFANPVIILLSHCLVFPFPFIFPAVLLPFPRTLEQQQCTVCVRPPWRIEACDLACGSDMRRHYGESWKGLSTRAAALGGNAK